ncbi:MAG: hypothetical protein HC834_10910 [Rhodospirillales bacterium]|nr:hypothetical protein [Rhodospirillales bacterium]
MRTNANDRFGALLPGCQNLRRDTIERQFITEYYLSTWGSAWVEGASQGVSQGLNLRPNLQGQGRSLALGHTDDRPRGVGTTTLPIPPTPYCRAVAASAENIRQAIETLLGSVGRPVVAFGEGGEEMETAFAYARHRAASWYDKYTIAVTHVMPSTSAVRILRPLFISRDGMVYNQAYSSGANEAWLIDEAERGAREARR